MHDTLRLVAPALMGTLLATAACGKSAHHAGDVESETSGGTTAGELTGGTATGGTTGLGSTNGGGAPNPNTGIIRGGEGEGSGPGSLDPHPAGCSAACDGNIVPIRNNDVTAQYCPAGNAPVGTAVPCEGLCFVAETVAPTWNHEPPSSGPIYPHYDYQWGEHTTPLARGAWVHNLAHGFIVIAYNCPNDCADDLAAVRNVVQQAAGARVILTPDPLLTTTPFAAMAWTWNYTFSRADPAALSCFIAQHNTNGWPH